MSTEKERLKELALAVNHGLNTYVATQNFIIHESRTFISVIKNLFRIGVPTKIFLGISKEISEMWDKIYYEVDTFKALKYSHLTTDEKHYLDILYNYVVAVQKSINNLIEMERVLTEKANGVKVSWREFRVREKIFKASIEEYCLIGRQLNSIKNIVFN